MRQKHTAASPDWAQRARNRGGHLWRYQLHQGRPRHAGTDAASVRNPIPERGAMEFADSGRERRTAARRIHRSDAVANSRARRAQTSTSGAKRVEDFYPNEISGGMQKRAGLA